MLLLNCALKLVEEIILYYDARSKKLQSALNRCSAQPLMRARIPDAVFVQLFLLRMGM